MKLRFAAYEQTSPSINHGDFCLEFLKIFPIDRVNHDFAFFPEERDGDGSFTPR